VKIRISSLSFVATLALAVGMISWGTALNAQTTPSTPSQTQQPETQPTPDTPPTQQTPQTQQAPMPDTPPAAQTPDQTPTPDQSQTPDQTQTPDSKTTPSATAPSATDTQSFSGTVVKSGDKFALKDDAGKTYDIDHQDEVKKFEGKRVKVQGTLDATGTKITVK
jgi:outer membrane biosynthesis protein TonB